MLTTNNPNRVASFVTAVNNAYQHDSDRCVFLGHVEEEGKQLDMYLSDAHKTLVVREDSEGSHYRSLPIRIYEDFEIKQPKKTAYDKTYQKAYELAKAYLAIEKHGGKALSKFNMNQLEILCNQQ